MEIYNTQFHENKWAHFLIPRINFEKGKESNVSALLNSNIKKERLKGVVNFLAKNFSNKYEKATEALCVKKSNPTKLELAMGVINFVHLSQPHHCLTCQSEYIPHNQSRTDIGVRAVCCVFCLIPAHNTCVNENDIDKNGGIVFACSNCMSLENNQKQQTKEGEINNSEDSQSNAEKCCFCDEEPEVQLINKSKINKKKGIIFLCTFCIKPENREKILKTNEAPHETESEEGEYEETQSEADADMTLTPSLLTPYQRQTHEDVDPSETINEQYGVEIEAVDEDRYEKHEELDTDYETATEKNNEEEISDRLRRVSISSKEADPEVEHKSNSTDKTESEKTKRKLASKTRPQIIKEYNKLKKQNDDLKQEKEKTTMKINELEKEVKIGEKYRESLRKLEEKMNNSESTSMEKIIYNAEVNDQTKEKIIEDLKKKHEEQKKKIQEHLKEIKDLKKQQEVVMNENTHLKAMGQKETELRIKSEALQKLTEDKLSTIEAVLRNLEGQEINFQPRPLAEILNNIATSKNLTVEEIDAINDNKEMKLIIDNLQSDLAAAKIEINIRKEQMDELIEKHALHLEEITNKNIRKEFEKEQEYKSLQKQIELLKRNENTGLAQQLQNKEKEVEKLVQELKKTAEERYTEIERVTKPPNRKQGLPNIYKNVCFMIAPIHALATTIQGGKLKDENPISNTILSTLECIEGKKNSEDAENIIKEMWSYGEGKWLEYKLNENNVCKQEDAAEFLARIINESETLRKETETIFKYTNTCKNPNCDYLETQHKESQWINIAEGADERQQINFKEMIEECVLKTQTSQCQGCKQPTTKKKEILKAPETLILKVPRTVNMGEKTKTTVTSYTGNVRIKEKNESILYGISSVVIHRGQGTQNGHYVTNHFNESRQEWEQIDDDRIIQSRNIKEETGNGLLFIFKKLEDEGRYDRQSKYYESRKHDYNKHQEQVNNSNKTYEPNRKAQNHENRYPQQSENQWQIYHRKRNRNTQKYDNYNKQGYWSYYRHEQPDEMERNKKYRHPEKYPEQSKGPDNPTSRYSTNGLSEQLDQSNYVNKPCRFFKHGICRNENCYYIHEYCRENNKGRCRFGEKCKYQHRDFDIRRSQNGKSEEEL